MCLIFITEDQRGLCPSKTYILTKVNILIFDPIILIITIAILDNLFEAKITSVEDILYTRVRAPRRSLEFR